MNRRRRFIPVAVVGSVGLALMPAVAQAATTPNPDLGIVLSETSSGAFGVTVVATVTGLNTSGVVGIDCGTEATSAGTSVNLPVTAASNKASVTCEFNQFGLTDSISAQVSDQAGDGASATLAGVRPAGAAFADYGPERILDTRSGKGVAAGAVASGGTLKLKVVGLGNPGNPIPSGITAVALNVTAVSPSANGYLSVYGNENQAGTPLTKPATSNLNFQAGQNVANLVVVPVGKDGTVDFYNSSKGSTQIVADIEGFFTTSSQPVENVALSGYTPITPVRMVDTRKGTGTGGKIAQIPADGTLVVQMAGVDGIGAASSVALHITAVGGTRNGVISAFPGNPDAVVNAATYGVSDVNYSAGQTASNTAFVTTSAEAQNGNPTGSVTFYNSGSGPVDLIVDAVGYYGYTQPAPGGASAYVPLESPARVVDTRTKDAPLTSGVPTDVTGTSDASETAAVYNATIVAPTGNGYLSVFPFNPGDPAAVPTTSSLNYLTGQTVPNLVVAAPGTALDAKTGTYGIGAYLGGKGTAQLVLDEFGYFAND